MLKEHRQSPWIVRLAATLACACVATIGVRGEDWPYFRGKDGLGVWNETGIIEKFPETGLKVVWRTPVKMGPGGPAVANGRVFVTDFEYTTRPRGIERVLALDEKTGKVLWTQQWETNYIGMHYAYGPRATPAVDGDLLYIQGAAGIFVCLDVKTGEVVWKKDFAAAYGTTVSDTKDGWGFTAPPLIDGERVISRVAGHEVPGPGEPNVTVAAFDKKTGKEIWKTEGKAAGIGYSGLLMVNTTHTRQLIVWYDSGIESLDSETGKIYWDVPWRPERTTTITNPVQAGNLLLFSGYYHGTQVFTLDEDKPGVEVLWKSKSESETVTDAIHSLQSTPVIVGDYVYGIDSHGELRCVDMRTGERVWATQAVTRDRALWASAHLVRNGDRFFINNDFGELIIAKLAPDGYHEISRTTLVTPTMPTTQRRSRDKINWTFPAYANKHVLTRNDEEIFSITLAAADYK